MFHIWIKKYSASDKLHIYHSQWLASQIIFHTLNNTVNTREKALRDMNFVRGLTNLGLQALRTEVTMERGGCRHRRDRVHSEEYGTEMIKKLRPALNWCFFPNSIYSAIKVFIICHDLYRDISIHVMIFP